MANAVIHQTQRAIVDADMLNTAIESGLVGFRQTVETVSSATWWGIEKSVILYYANSF